MWKFKKKEIWQPLKLSSWPREKNHLPHEKELKSSQTLQGTLYLNSKKDHEKIKKPKYRSCVENCGKSWQNDMVTS